MNPEDKEETQGQDGQEPAPNPLRSQEPQPPGPVQKLKLKKIKETKEWDYGFTSGATYKYGLATISLFVTDVDKQNGVQEDFEKKALNEIDPTVKEDHLFVGPNAKEVHAKLSDKLSTAPEQGQKPTPRKRIGPQIFLGTREALPPGSWWKLGPNGEKLPYTGEQTRLTLKLDKRAQQGKKVYQEIIGGTK